MDEKDNQKLFKEDKPKTDNLSSEVMKKHYSERTDRFDSDYGSDLMKRHYGSDYD